MIFQRVNLVLLATLAVAGFQTGQALSAAPALPVVAQFHWLGLNQISADTNSAQFLKVWHLPQTAALVNQTLDKCSRWPAGGATNAATALLRPLLDDLVSSESRLEIRALPNAQSATGNFQLLVALRLPAARVWTWQTNLAAVCEDLTGAHPVSTASGWTLAGANPVENVGFSRAGKWILISLGQGSAERLPAFAASLTSNPAPSSADWLEADLALARLDDVISRSASPSGAAGWGELGTLNGASIARLFSVISDFHFTVAGESGRLRTLGTFTLEHPLTNPLPAWEFPTNLIHQSLSGFTAMRGIDAELAAWPVWQKTRFAPAPDQMFFWAQAGVPFQTYLAAPLPGAGNQLHQLAARLVAQGNPWLATNGQGNFQWQTNPPGLMWNDALIISPFLRPVTVNQHAWLLGGLYPLNPGDATSPPASLLHSVLATPNLIYYQFEDTGLRVDAGLFITQLFRVVFHKPQLPPAAAATQWLKAAEPLLGDSTTEIIRTSPQTCSFARRSTLGFTALELHLLADWLESPQFPHGLHTFLAPPKN